MYKVPGLSQPETPTIYPDVDDMFTTTAFELEEKPMNGHG